MSGPTSIPLARAASHLAAARYAEAAGAYRAVLCIDPHAHEAYLGLADCAIGRGQPDEAIEELVGAAQDFAERGALEPAFALMTKALLVDPSRLELHIDVAELEASAGRLDLAIGRLENLAHAYEAAGQYDEAMAVIEAAEAYAAMDRDEEAEVPEPGTTTLVTPRAALAEEVVAIDLDAEIEEAIEAAPMQVVPVVEAAPIQAVPVAEAAPIEVAATHTVPMQVMPPARTGDTFVGPAPGPRPRAEQSVARTATRRRQSGPALRWRPSTIQMQALTAEIPKPEQLVRSGLGVPRTVAPVRTAPIVHAPTKRRSDPTIVDGSRSGRRGGAPTTTSVDAKRDAGAPMPAKVIGTKPLVVKPIAAKPIALKPIAAKPVAVQPSPVKLAKPIEAKPIEAKPIEAKPITAAAKAGRKLEIRPLPGRAKPRPAPAPTRQEARPSPAPTRRQEARPAPAPARQPDPRPIAAARPVEPRKAAPAPKPQPKRTAPPPRAADPTPRKEGESLADRLRRQSTGRHHLAAKVKRIADAEKRRLTREGYDEDATTLWCPDNLRLPEGRA